MDGHTVTPPEGRKAVFLGDLGDRGPKTPDVLRLVMGMCAAGTALCVPGNHDVKLLRKLRGKDVQITHGLAETLAQLEPEPPEFIAEVKTFLDGLISHYVLDDGKLVVAHAGMKAEMQGRGSGKVREFALYGETTGETDEFGLPIRYPWAEQYRGQRSVVYGHTPVPTPEWLNHTLNIDTGCVFGGKLTALRYPEREIVSVPAAATYAEPARPFLPAEQQSPALSAQQQHDDVLDIDDVIGKRLIETRLHGKVTIREENAIAALEVMSRFAVNPKWLIYLPPTMSPSETTREPGLLEHPAEAFAYYRNQGIPTVICEEKHMGSRAVVIVCRSEDAARARFGVEGEGIGVCVTRTGRRFFDNLPMETAFLTALSAGDGRKRPVGRTGDGLGLPGLRTHALVGKGAGIAETAVRRCRRGSDSGSAASRFRAPTGGGPHGGSRPAAGKIREPRGNGGSVRGSLPALLLAGAFPVRFEAGSVSPAGLRRAGAFRQRTITGT